ncbi:hypothetical protein BKI51_13050 [Alphaproteobacteria bacterium AO1-B]|nr:hypothetical protein BKI51_13050 [Alphaproteobacteria bacterium AO1-B]
MSDQRDRLDALILRAKAHKMTPAERREQRVSLIMGFRGNESSLTRENVEKILEDNEGYQTQVTV